MIQVVRVSGTIRKAEEAAIRLARLSIRRAQRQAGDVDATTLGMSETSRDNLTDAGPSINDDSAGISFTEGIEDDDQDDDEKDD